MHGPHDPVRTSSGLLLKPDRLPIYSQVLTFRHFENVVVENLAAIRLIRGPCSDTRTFQAGLRRVRPFSVSDAKETATPPDAEGSNRLRFFPKLAS
jgi:hypothetical protein